MIEQYKEQRLKEFEEKFSCVFNVGVVPDDITKENLKSFLLESIDGAYEKFKAELRERLENQVKVWLEKESSDDNYVRCFDSDLDDVMLDGHFSLTNLIDLLSPKDNHHDTQNN